MTLSLAKSRQPSRNTSSPKSLYTTSRHYALDSIWLTSVSAKSLKLTQPQLVTMMVTTSLQGSAQHSPMVSNVTVNAAAVGVQNRNSDTSPESLAQMWRIGVPQATLTLHRTMQQGTRQAAHPVTRRCRNDTPTMRCCHLCSLFHTDTVPVNVKSLQQNT